MPDPYKHIVFAPGVDWKHVSKALLRNLDRLGAHLGRTMTVISGFRTYQQQAALYQAYVNSGYSIAHIAAKPGHSNHEHGLAVDVLINGVAIKNVVSASTMRKFGLVNPVAGDNPHTELVGGGTPTHASSQEASYTGQGSAAPHPMSVNSSPDMGQPYGVGAADNLGGPATASMPEAYDPATYRADGFNLQQNVDNWQAISADPAQAQSAQMFLQNAQRAAGSY